MFPKTNPLKEQEIIQDYKNNLPTKELLIKNKISYSGLLYILRRNNIPNREPLENVKKETIQQVIQDYNNGLSHRKIAFKNNVQEKNISGILKRNNVKTNRIKIISKETKNEIIKDFLNGIETKNIAVKFSLDYKTVNKFLNKNNLFTRKRPIKITNEIEFKIIELLRNNISYKEIIKTLNISNTPISKVIKKYNIKTNREIFTKEQINFLIENYPKYGFKYCEEKLGVPSRRLKPKIVHLKLKRLKPQTKEGFKLCCKCKKEKEIFYFGKGKGRKDGLKSHCKSCGNFEGGIRKIVRRAILNKKENRTFKYLGCSFEFFKQYIEQQFKLGMTWENYGSIEKGGLWHLDHIRPFCTFNLPEQIYECCNYKNIRPLWITTEIARKYGDFESIGNLNRNKTLKKEREEYKNSSLFENSNYTVTIDSATGGIETTGIVVAKRLLAAPDVPCNPTEFNHFEETKTAVSGNELNLDSKSDIFTTEKL